ncbi:MAG: hypothetical protein DRP62_03695 [Planctomycetota bacterium]|nr:MAG: hypothetical protein DRP62_03695 [Planctomycetota bacterium]
MADKATAVHVTHEAVGKIGGIGAVLQGLFTCNSYLEAIGRSIIIGPLFSTDGIAADRLGEDGEVLYSSVDGLVKTGYASGFRKIENFYNVGIVYGRRTFTDEQTGIKSSPEVLLIDVKHTNELAVNEFKKHLFEKFGIRSHLYEHLWEYEQYVRLGPPAIAALKVIDAATDSTTIIAHEFMGMPTALAAILEPSYEFKTIFYAHEVATMRHIVEKHPGHDTMFYNVIKHAHNNKLYVSDVFGDQSSFFKHALVEASKYCDTICAVGDYVVNELRFLSPEFETANIDIVYNGIPAYKISVDEKLKSKEKLQLYCENLLKFKPDFIFTHVTRLVRSKGLWRDLQILYAIEKEFRTQGKTAVLFLLSTEVSQRRSRDIYDMESEYGWPVAHREGASDLSGGEAYFYTAIQQFNAQSRNIKVVFINQFGFERRLCGLGMPEDMEFMDIRKGSDVEFGMSIYEPFGISQLEPLSFGGICVISNVCGCAGFVKDVTSGTDIRNIIISDYTDLDSHFHGNASIIPLVKQGAVSAQAGIENILHIDRSVRNRVEASESKRVAKEIILRLPKNRTEIQDMIQAGYSLAGNMSWDVVVKNYLLPSLQKAAKTPWPCSV